MINYNRLRQLRIERKISLKDMADALGLQTPGGYSRIESGENKLNAAHLPIIAEKFDMVLDQLVKEIFFEHQVDDCSSHLKPTATDAETA